MTRQPCIPCRGRGYTPRVTGSGRSREVREVPACAATRASRLLEVLYA